MPESMSMTDVAFTEAPSPARRRDHTSPGRRRARYMVPALGVLVISGLVFARSAGTNGTAAGDGPAVPTASADVARRTLVESIVEDGALGYGAATTLKASRAGVVTSTAGPGSIVERGGTLFALDRQPVVLLYGEVPAYRQLFAGLEGLDVRQLEENLVALGHGDGVTVDEDYTAATAEAVRRFQHSVGLRPTGVVDVGSVLFFPGPVRAGTTKATAGASVASEAEVVEVAGSTKVVTVKLEARRAASVKVGDVTGIDLATGKTTAGKIASVGKVAAKADEDSEPTVDVIVSLDDPAVVDDLDQAPVEVTIKLGEKTALAVPVNAVVALREGGSAVEVIEGQARRFVPVELGVFADGYVEVSGNEIREGMKVVVPT